MAEPRKTTLSFSVLAVVLAHVASVPSNAGVRSRRLYGDGFAHKSDRNQGKIFSASNDALMPTASLAPFPMGNSVSPKFERVALIGCGAASEILYASALDKLSAERVVEVTALVDPNPERTLAIGKKFPLARHHLNVDSMLAETAPDLAIIVTPHRIPCGSRGKVSGKRVSCPLRKTDGDNHCRLRSDGRRCRESRALVGRRTLSPIISIQPDGQENAR